jgi:hypothetical protein
MKPDEYPTCHSKTPFVKGVIDMKADSPTRVTDATVCENDWHVELEPSDLTEEQKEELKVPKDVLRARTIEFINETLLKTAKS